MVIKTEQIQDDIVITGISGRFPECDTVAEFQDKLMSGIDLVKENDSRWPKGYLGTYSRMGFIKDLRNFDASFFGAHPKLAERTDPIVRTLLETSVEAILDAGICPTAIRGSETGVVVGVSSNEAADWWSADPDRVNGYEFLGCTRTMYSNRISFALDLKGPSYTMDSQSSSGLLGVQQAYYMLKTGMVDAVIVAGVNLVLNPHFNIMFQKLNMLSPDGKCKVFDADADGYARSEAGVAIVMQRLKDAKRVYATVVGTESNCDGFKEYGCNSVSLSSQISLYRDAYDRFKLNPLDVSYVEAHGYSTREGDKIELMGITEEFCKERDSPLLVGSVKSNMGHSEPAGGLVSVVKVLLAMESDILPPNIHFKIPNPDVPALKDGRLKVVDKLTVWNGKYAAINSFGIGGTNSHLVLRRHEKEKKTQRKTDIPRLMVVSGRTESAVRSLLSHIETTHNDNEFCALLYGIFSQHIPHFNQRAFSIFDNNNESTIEISTYTPRENSRPICFVFSGMGSQWPGMCKQLLKISSFRKTMDACANVLKTVDFDLYELLNSEDKATYDNVLNSFVGITCIQIALVNILYELEIKPNFIIGHSIGELGCAYADDSLTLEQTVLATYWRGKSLLMTDIAAGAMAAIGLSCAEVTKLLPSDITVACHNSQDSVTISGPPQSIAKFTKELQAKGIFAREVNSSGYAFHSQYIAKAGPIFESKLGNVIRQPKLRTKRWISTSIPESWNTPMAQYSSVAYHLNNLLSPVYFNKALSYVPENAVVIEIAPHALLQSILKSSLSSTCAHIGLVRRNQATVTDFLANIGRLYNAGLHPKLENLYPPVNFPVSRKTPMIQSLIEWDHSIKWFLISFMTKPACVHGEVESYVDVLEERYAFLTNCIVDDTPTFPIAGYLSLIWEAVAKFQLDYIVNVPFVIENFQLLRKCTLSRENPLKFNVNILEGTGECEIREDDVIVARANVKISENIEDEFSTTTRNSTTPHKNLPLKPTDIYLDLHMKGYDYKKEFRGIKYTDNDGEHGSIKWNENWTTFLESLLQLHLLRLPKQRHYAIDHIKKIVIDPKEHMELVNGTNTDSGIPVEVFADIGVIKSGGIEIRGVKSTLVSIRKKQPEPTVQYYSFVSHFPEHVVEFDHALSTCLQVVCENSDVNTSFKIGEILNSENYYLRSKISEIIAIEPYIKEDLTIYTKDSATNQLDEEVTVKYDNFSNEPASTTQHFMVTSNVFSNLTTVKNVLHSLDKTGFLLSIEQTSDIVTDETLDDLNCKLIAKFTTEKGICLLIRKTPVWKTPMVVVVKSNAFNWVDGIKMALRKHKIDKRNTMIIFHGNEPTGVVGLLKSIRREPYGTGLRCLFTDDSIHPYKIVDLTYINYFRKGLVFNVFKNGEWGSYRHFSIEEPSTVKCEHAFIAPREIGNFSSLCYIEGRIPHIDLQQYPNHELCYVYYSSIYAHDLRSALGQLPYDDHTNVTKQGSVLGHEYSGRDSKGRRVFGMVGGGALATTVLADRTVMWEVPDRWSLEQASTVPRVYSVAYYALVMRGNLEKGETVYINAGIMGLCVACMNVAIGIGAIPFIGYNNQNEKKYLQETLPGLSEKSFVSLEEDHFELYLLNATDGNGVDLIFDTLNSHKRNQFVDALAQNGRLVEFEKSTVFNESLGYSASEKNITFHKVSHHTLWVSDSGMESRKKIHQLVQEGVRIGVVKPIVTNIYSDEQIEEAFRVAQSGKFVGKVVIKFRDEEPQKCVIPKTKIVNAYPSAFMDPNHSYIVTTGLSEYGIQTVDWLISRGAVKIILQSQYNPVTGYQYLTLQRWKNDNVEIVLSNVDVSVLSGAENLINIAASVGPVGGIFHIGHVGCESTFDQSSHGHFELVWKAKQEIAKNLDIVSRKQCNRLKYFVGFSDSSSIFGKRGRSVHGYACAAMEMIYESRNNDNLPALVIQKGELEQLDVEASNDGFERIKFSSILKMLPELLNQPHPVVCVYRKGSSLDHRAIDKEVNELIYDIADILGIRFPEKTPSLTFEEIGIEPLVLEKIKTALEYRKINFTKDDIKKLSFNRLSSITI